MRRSPVVKTAVSLHRTLGVIGLMGLASMALSQHVFLDCYYNNEWRKDSTGVASRYHYVWDDTTNSGFSQLERIILDAGGSTDTLCQAPTPQSLRRADIYIIVDPDTPKETPVPHYIQPAEADAIEQWVKAGGILVLLGNDKGNSEFEHFNKLAGRFGIRFNEVSQNRVQGRDYATGAFEKLPSHPLFTGVGKIFLKEISTLRLDSPAEALLSSGEDVVMASAEVGKGFVFAVGDPWVYNEYMDQRRLPADYGNALAAENLFRWLFSRSRAALPFEMPAIQVPRFPPHRFEVVEYGAVPDGRTKNTRAFAAAIAACSEAGGGTVVVPPGTWLTGPIRLASNVNLHLQRGAVLQFSSNIEDFPLIDGFAGTSKRYIVTPPLSAYRATNIAITGEGIIDGAGDVWRYVKKEKLTARQWKELTASGGAVTADGKQWWPSKEAMDGEAYLKKIESSGKPLTAQDYAKAREFLRPDLFYPVQCNGLLIDGPTFQNSPRFHIHPIQCEDLTIRNVKVFAPWYAQNADGIDLSSCRRVLVENATVDVGDDGLCLKPGNLATSQSPGPACEHIIIRDCVVYHAHGGFVIGSESFGGVRNVAVRNCVFVGTDVGLRFKSARDRGGLVEKVYIDGIRMRDIATDAILFDMYYAGGAPDVEATKDLTNRAARAVTDRTPQFRDLSIRNVVCDGAKRAMVINGLPEMPVKNIVLDSVSLMADAGVFLADAENIQMTGCSFFPAKGPVLTVIQSRSILLQGGTVSAEANPVVRVVGENSRDIRFRGIDKSRVKATVELGKNVRADAVKWE